MMTTTQKMRLKYILLLIKVIEAKCLQGLLYNQVTGIKGIIVEQILVVCVNRTRFNELFDTILTIASFPRYILKKYLFHLIEYSIISYQGKNQVYVITRTGLELLSIVNREKRTTQLDFKDIVV